MGKHPDVLVVGGGIIGLTSAYFLARAGLSVEVIDKGDLGREASWAGAGILPPGNVDRAATPIDRLRAVGSHRFPGFSAELLDSAGINNGYLPCGGVEFLTQDEAYAEELWRAEGVPFRELDTAELRQLVPNIEPVPNARPFHLPGMAQVRNPWHLRALIAGCERLGVRLTPHTPFIGWGQIGSKVITAQTMNADRKPAGSFVIAGGSWSRQMLRPLDCQPAVRPVRGQIILFRPDNSLFSQVLMVGKRYLVPRGDGRVLVGSTEEPEAGYKKATTPEAIDELTQFATKLVPALAASPIETAWSGLRPGSPDGMPFLGPVPGFDNVIAAVGHFRAGVQLSLGTAEIVTHLICRTPLPCSIDAFRLDRVPEFTTRPAFRS